MATGVGLRIAEDECIAAILTSGGEPDAEIGASEDSPEPLYIVREPVLYMSDEGDTALGGEPPAGHTHSITGFFAAVGDPAGIPVDDGEAYRAEDLVATALFCLINLAADHLNGPAEFYATYPAAWPQQQVNALREALDYLGLRAVVLVSEADLPGSDDGSGRGFAHDAARAALASVLATPAGTTPPDPTHTENALVVTDVLPALASEEPPVQAYSAAIPVAAPATAAVEEQTTTGTTTEPARKNRRIPLLIAGAVIVGLMLGGLGVALLFRENTTTPVPPLPDAHSQLLTTTAPPPPPPTTLPVTTTTIAPAPPPVEPTETTETTTPPPPPTTTTPPPTTTTTPSTPSSTQPRTTPRRTAPNPLEPIPGLPLPPPLQLPQNP
ncbi:hypothetical protein [Nocardia transvalensis]|uniref:hypothetical protein n=1 Tax=Nocardia transvalensis TaxID=37333 RepID=UPI001895BF42|nr:hypothetical protein [Nocardia transvalensis]MBF6329027.1 hypothetical protein [Nocardia transvalensis]